MCWAHVFCDIEHNLIHQMRSETFTIFSGGLSTERDGKSPCITVLQGRSTTVLEMEHPVVDFITICESPWASGKLMIF